MSEGREAALLPPKKQLSALRNPAAPAPAEAEQLEAPPAGAEAVCGGGVRGRAGYRIKKRSAPPSPPPAAPPASEEQEPPQEGGDAPPAPPRAPSDEAPPQHDEGLARQRRGRLPAGWAESSPGGAALCGLCPVKTPLSEDFALPERIERWTPADCVRACGGEKVRLLIDLTASSRYYSPDQLPPAVVYHKMPVAGHGVPSEEQVACILDRIGMMRSEHGEGAVVVIHCTHGLNRTGYIVVRALVELHSYSLIDALDAFGKLRPPGLWRGEYVHALHQRYQGPRPQLPPPPEWEAHAAEAHAEADAPGGRGRGYGLAPLEMDAGEGGRGGGFRGKAGGRGGGWVGGKGGMEGGKGGKGMDGGKGGKGMDGGKGGKGMDWGAFPMWTPPGSGGGFVPGGWDMHSPSAGGWGRGKGWCEGKGDGWSGAHKGKGAGGGRGCFTCGQLGHMARDCLEGRQGFKGGKGKGDGGDVEIRAAAQDVILPDAVRAAVPQLAETVRAMVMGFFAQTQGLHQGAHEVMLSREPSAEMSQDGRPLEYRIVLKLDFDSWSWKRVRRLCLQA
ncbi:hypothetical protein AB1Y20_023751 [Prymnesium parvum]|uniref:Protein-tyrosine-phosphatase n=1 Tax=Prymnesium parvum TaxID=97485 RepID=A0AB34JHA5_PRYPA